MTDWKLARRYQATGLSFVGMLKSQWSYSRDRFQAVLEGAELVLDLGCGDGRLTNLLAPLLPRTSFIGVDASAENIRLADQCRTAPNIKFQAADPFSAATTRASAVLFNKVLGRLPAGDQERALVHASRCLDGSGVLVLHEIVALDQSRASSPGSSAETAPNFRTAADWIALVGRHGFRLVQRASGPRPWGSDHTMLVFSQIPRPPGPPRPVPNLTGNPPPTRLLLTGGTGFIGGQILHELLNEGLQGRPVHVGVITRRPWSLPVAVRQDPRITVIAVDLAQPVAPEALGEPWDCVFHLAADANYFGGKATYQNNLSATSHLLAALRGTPVRRLVYASTMGAIDRARSDRCNLPLDESAPANPSSLYGSAKVKEEALVRQCGIPAVIIRIPWCYGPGMARTSHVRQLLNGVRVNSLVMRFAWPGRVSLVSVAGAARIFVAAAHVDGVTGQTLFISDGQPVSFGELFVEMGRLVGNPAAGRIKLPGALIGLIRLFHFLLPFQIKALVCDALVVSNDRARQLALGGPDRNAWYLDSLARFDAAEAWPNRWRQAALVTGAASGIGRALARQFHARGYGLHLIDRDAGELPRLAAELSASHLVLDLSQLDSARTVEQLAGTTAARIALVVNNAGLGFRGGYAALSPATMEKTVAVNIRAVIFITTGFSREMSLHGGGTIVNIASTAALQPLPYMAAYAASKSFVLSFTLATAAERDAPPGVRLLAVCPSGTSTNFQASGGVKILPDERLFTPEDTAAAILQAIAVARPLTILGARGQGMALFARLVPTRMLVHTWETLMRSGR